MCFYNLKKFRRGVVEVGRLGQMLVLVGNDNVSPGAVEVGKLLVSFGML